MQIEQIPIDWLKPYENNPRKNDHAVAKVAASIKEFGFRVPIVTDEAGVIIAGHTRYHAAKLLGLTEVPVHKATGLTEAQIKAYRLADNRVGQEATWDNDLLTIELQGLKDLNFDLELTGFNLDEITGLLDVTTGLTDPDSVPDFSDNCRVTTGDIWNLGRHKLMCGDASSFNDINSLMNGELADMVFTDPPYNVDYEGRTENKMKIKNDNMSSEDFKQSLIDWFAGYAISVKQGASLYICHSSAFQRNFQDALEQANFDVRQQIIWAKNNFSLGFSRYRFQHEPIFYCHVVDQKDTWYGDRSQTTLWQIPMPQENKLHPTMKPIALIEIALQNSSKAGDIVLDLFGGSGSTLIAAEKNARTARMMEIDPKYCDVIIRRWEEFTGQQAEKVE